MTKLLWHEPAETSGDAEGNNYSACRDCRTDKVTPYGAGIIGGCEFPISDA